MTDDDSEKAAAQRPATLRHFFEELKRRSVIGEAIAYIVASVLLIELADIVTGAFNAPSWVLQGFIAVVAVGFIPAVALAWAYELTPGGLRRAGEEPTADRPVRNRRLAVFTLAMVLAVAALYVLFPAIDRTPETPRSQTEASPDGPVTIAALPLATVGAGEEAALLADGMLDDLLSQLARIATLRVISRKAVLAYRDSSQSPAEIGAELNAQALLLGTVQVAEDRWRLRVQLLDTETGAQLWAESFERDLDPASLFQVQGEVSRAIARALSATLTDEDQRRLDALPTENMAAYRSYHRALQARYDTVQTGQNRTDEYLKLLRQAVAEDPRFARAWAQLVYACSWNGQGGDPQMEACATEGLAALRDLAPESAEYRMAQASYLYYLLQDYEQALVAIGQAITLQPSEPRHHELKLYIARRMGDPELIFEASRDLWALDPANPQMILGYGWALLGRGHLREALELFQRIPPGRDYNVDFLRSFVRLGLDNDPEAHVRRLQAWSDLDPQLPIAHQLWYAQMMAGDFIGAAQTLEDIEAVDYGHGLHPLSPALVHGLYTFHHGNDPERLGPRLRSAEQALAANDGAAGNLRQRLELLLAEALVAALQGDGEAARARVRAWEYQAGQGGFTYAGGYFRAHACFIIAITRAADDLLACIRVAVREPHWPGAPPILRFWPGYEFVQGHPEFEEILDRFGE